MKTVVGPVIVTREGGFGFDLWTPEEGLSRGFSYGRVEDAHHARKFEIRTRAKSAVGSMVACDTLDEFASALADRRQRLWRRMPLAIPSSLNSAVSRSRSEPARD
jgi:hypothetical protein